MDRSPGGGNQGGCPKCGSEHGSRGQGISLSDPEKGAQGIVRDGEYSTHLYAETQVQGISPGLGPAAAVPPTAAHSVTCALGGSSLCFGCTNISFEGITTVD